MKKGMRVAIKPIRIDGHIAYVPLSQGLQAIIDAADVPLVEKYNWIAMCTRGVPYAGRVSGGRTVKMHRLILGEPKNIWIDHKDMNTLNNRRQNLRRCTPSQNQANKRANSNNRLGVKGVCRQQGKFHAQITFNRKNYHLGFHETIEEASAAYEAKAREFFGDFARVN